MKEQVVNGYMPKNKWEYWQVQRDLKTDKMPLWYRMLLKEKTKNANIGNGETIEAVDSKSSAHRTGI